jgi:predicted nucleic acid-binding protein
MKAFLLDTNVIIDFFDDARPMHDCTTKLICKAIEREYGILYPVTSLKDFYYLYNASLKARLKNGLGEIEESQALFANEVAWSAIESLSEFATAVGCDNSDVWIARKNKAIHNDFEDDLVIAAAMRSEATLVSNDKKLVQHCPTAALNVEDALSLLENEVL